ncbi:hypothetical protein SAMN05216364_10065 [Porphyromonadaceae bacterium KHP3R9]|nr:hypothetical protein SAMN05216364_10065 [Porphyromonadaceae bacterium KHP3R9]
MKKVFVLAIAGLIFISCKSEYEKNLTSMSEQFKQHLEDEAFKNNATIEYLVFEPIKYDTVTEKEYYNRLLSLYDQEFDRHKKIVDLNSLKREQVINIAKLAKLAGDKDEIEEAKREFDHLVGVSEKEVKILQKIIDQMDSIGVLLDNKDEEMYQLQLFFKGVFKEKSGDSDNKMDTIYPLFDKEFKLVVIPNVTIDDAS